MTQIFRAVSILPDPPFFPFALLQKGTNQVSLSGTSRPLAPLIAPYDRYGFSSYMLVHPAELVLEILKTQSDLTITPDEFVNMLVFTGHWVMCQWPQNLFSLIW
jgi:hypothetical protein